jgi:YVTN family beta-propeller protein
MNEYILLVLHKLEESFGYYDVQTGQQLSHIKTRPFPHEICLDPARKKIYIAEMGVRGIESEGPGGHTIAVFNIKARIQISEIDTGKYDRPHGVATFGNRLYVTSESTKYLLIYDLATEDLISAVYLDQDCAHMVGIAPDGKTAYTANIWSNSITAVDTMECKVLYHIPVPQRPEGMAFSPDGSLMYCVCREARTVAVVDCQQGKMIDKMDTGKGPVRIVITPDGSLLGIPLFHSAAVEIADTKTRKVIHTFPVGPHPAGTCISPDGKLVFMSCEDENLVYVFDLDNLAVINKIKTGNGADAMVCLYSSEIR